jgi:uncharacterized protein YjiS (DUF1127 family)
MSAEWDRERLPLTAFVSPPQLRRVVLRAIPRGLHAWCQRGRQRGELSLLSERDLADLGIPKMLAVEEARRWPWQQWQRRWRELDAERRATADQARNL